MKEKNSALAIRWRYIHELTNNTEKKEVKSLEKRIVNSLSEKLIK